MARPPCRFLSSRNDWWGLPLIERMAKKDLRWFLAFMGVVVSALAFAVIGNV
jgi:hypothetical protein